MKHAGIILHIVTCAQYAGGLCVEFLCVRTYMCVVKKYLCLRLTA